MLCLILPIIVFLLNNNSLSHICSGGSPPGLSVSQSNRVTGKTPLNHDMLVHFISPLCRCMCRQVHACSFYFQACLLAKDELIIFYGYSSFRHEPVIRRGEELLKKKTSGVQFDDAKLINRLFLLFNGMESLTICYISYLLQYLKEYLVPNLKTSC